ncbi:hypothetical protein [Allosalinactinospora lopnorensis]|uniref:hypothetical protein n=1 Tax=Allosalinactinospora lopnorensis TaxID=1352348 RepID=UPI0006967BA1|nr:hypothetical protein [Allosalinactinospora lopnorensis]
MASCAIEAARRGAQLDTPVGAYTIDELTAAMYEVADAYPYSPVLPSLLRARELRDQAWRLQERCQRPNQLRDLHHIAGWLCAILANASFDLGSTASAQTHARVADLHGELIDDHGLRAWVAGLHALIAYWDGRPHDCVAYAESARRFHPTRGTTLVRAASIHARGLALLRRHDDVDAALHEAERLRDNAGEDLPGVIAFPHAKQLYWASSAHLGLGLSERAQAAENAAASAITLYEADPPQLRRDGELGHARLDYVTARLAGDEFDGIAEEVNTVLVSMRQRRIESVMRRLRQLTTVLQKPALRSNRHLREVHEAIDADLRYSPPIAALPTGDTAL